MWKESHSSLMNTHKENLNKIPANQIQPHIKALHTTPRELILRMKSYFNTWKSINTTHHTDRIKDRNQIISTDAETTFHKIQHPFIIKKGKTFHKIGLESNILNHWRPTTTTSIQHGSRGSSQYNKARKRNKKHQNWKKVKLSSSKGMKELSFIS